MDEAMVLNAQARAGRFRRLGSRVRASAPTRVEWGLSVASAALLVLSFPNFDLWPLAWAGLVPLFVAVARRPERGRAFLLGWATGTLFFYGSCYWLTYAMVRYGEIPAWIAYPLLIPVVVVVGLFPATCCLLLARALARWGPRALLAAPFFWVALEWGRLGLTGQLWNAVGYSQAYVPTLILPARWGGVYAVGFLIVSVNAALAYALLLRSGRALKSSAIAVALVACLLLATFLAARSDAQGAEAAPDDAARPEAVVIAVQPNVPMESFKSAAEMESLINRHLTLSEGALAEWERSVRGLDSSAPGAQAVGAGLSPSRPDVARVVVWPESPMNFSYARDTEFRDLLARFAGRNHTSVLFNSQEPAPANGTYNAAVMVNEEGRLIAQYDKIRLLPFGEYVPLPRWLPGVSLIPTMVGDFTPGAEYPLMPLGQARAGVFICFESAFPSITRHFVQAGADVLVNITNDGYLGPTPVMRQHLANTIFRAVENNRPVLRVTNTGITAHVSGLGRVTDETKGYEPAVRAWSVRRTTAGKTFYTQYGDLFVGSCALFALALAVASWSQRPASGAGRARIR
ncbi:MAG TPA: apolipoprotein N-acyltransferase [Pyrinomonadaceae bacterium]|jgi:apolipoprotein N-acyltransferase